MSITREEAWNLLNEFNKEPFHIRHAEVVEGIMKYFARKLGYGEEEEFWAISRTTLYKRTRNYERKRY